MYIWKQLWAYTKPYKRFLFYSLFALMLSTTIFIVGTMMTKIIIDKYIILTLVLKLIDVLYDNLFNRIHNN